MGFIFLINAFSLAPRASIKLETKWKKTSGKAALEYTSSRSLK
ncbi:MAG TPA: hypothetical protein VGB68_10645 [Pyrinomonadaceae bacterium]